MGGKAQLYVKTQDGQIFETETSNLTNFLVSNLCH